MIKNEIFILNNGVKIPAIGFGTWQVADGEEGYSSCLAALKLGYRHIDTAFAYGNEPSVARALRDSGLSHEDVFITTKLPADIKNYDGARAHFEASLKNLETDYLDLYLIHAPWPWSDVGGDYTEGNIAVWRAMIDLYNEGKVRAIGVSNFHVKDIKAIVDATGFVPAVNQIRYFIGNTQNEITEYCQANGILVEAYSPLATGALVEHEELCAMAERYGVTIPQLCIRFCIENGTLPLPKSVNEARIKANLEVDFEISKEDMAYLNSLYHIGPTRLFRS
ncbi:MAG: aldo/keto reductase [Clostridia bacterium]|nr:aldo/keto reductase [Clostridia bacterium]